MPESSDRRTFLKRSAAAASALAAGCGPSAERSPADGERPTDAATGDGPSGRRLPDSVLGAVAEVVLPSELDPDARSRVVAEFAIWIRDFAPVAEQVHGYGSQEIRYGPPDPFPAWTAQLDGLDAEARARHRVGFADLALEDRRALLEAALRAADGSLGDRPDALEADHVAVGLLGYFYGSAEAVNLCYERRIDPRACRPLETSGDRPAPLAVRTAASGQAHRRLAERSTPPGAAFERGLEPGS